jgi:hypothetical protein
MSFQITILKVLAGHPEGRASLADLKRESSDVDRHLRSK